MHSFVVYAHILGVLLFMLAHGASAAVIFRMRREHDPASLRLLLSLSKGTLPAAYGSLLLLIVAGVWAGIEIHAFDSGQWWLWASVAILVLILGAMWGMISPVYHGMRRALGASGPVADQAALDAGLADPRPMAGMGVAFLGILVILWLMVAKPF